MAFSDNIYTGLLNRALDIQLRNNRQEKIWSFLSPDNVMEMPKAVDFGNNKFSISIIDQFGRCRPRLMNYRDIDDRDVAFAPTIILDSNVASYISQFVVQSPNQEAAQRKTIHELLRHLVKTHSDYNPFFYYLESFVKDEYGMARPPVIEATEAIIRLHSMSEELFLQTGEIKPDPVTFEKYVEKFNTTKYTEMAIKQVEWSIEHNPYDNFENMCSAIYICLMKMALIQMQKVRNTSDKYIQMREFMIDTLGIVMGRELYIALSYFSGLLDNFIPLIQRNAKFDRIKRRLKSAAWDVLLLRFPENFLAHGWPKPVTLGYVCTADKALQRIGKGTKITAILCLEPHASSPTTLLNHDYGEIAERIGVSTLNHLILENEQWQSKRWQSTQSERAMPKEIGLDKIIAVLEEEIHSLCTN